MDAYRRTLIAANQLTACSAELLEAMTSGDAVDVDNAMGFICDAIVHLGELADSDERDGQLVAAAYKWIGENR